MPNSSAKLLIVDDEPIVVEYLTKMLCVQGYDIRKAYDGDEAVSIAQKFLPDCVLTGVMMPRMGGFEEAITILQFLPACKFIFMSGAAKEPSIRAQHEQLGPEIGPLLDKPFSQRDLLNALAAAGCPGAGDQ